MQIEVDENGVLRVKDPALYGKTFNLSFPDPNAPELTRETDWEAIKEIFKRADELDFPRRSHEEIIRDLHELRG